MYRKPKYDRQWCWVVDWPAYERACRGEWVAETVLACVRRLDDAIRIAGRLGLDGDSVITGKYYLRSLCRKQWIETHPEHRDLVARCNRQRSRRP